MRKAPEIFILIAAPARQGCCPGMACPHYRYWLFGEAFMKEESAEERVPRGGRQGALGYSITGGPT